MAELDLTNIAAASVATPAAGVTAIFVDTANKHVSQKDDTGTVIDLAAGGGGGGAQGLQGAPGFDGEPGEDGFLQGPPGATGPAGAAGAPGATGQPGQPGQPGQDGQDGSDSMVPGPPGPAGAAGAPGSPGAQGAAGLPGFDGDPGDDSFIPGPPGASGAAGATGPPGSGQPGPTGQDGQDGEDSWLLGVPQRATPPFGVVPLTFATTLNTDVSNGSEFTVTVTNNFTLANPTGQVDGQMVIWRIKQDGTGSRLITLDSNFRLGTDLSSVVLTTTAGKTDYLGAVWNAADAKWDVIAFAKGY